MKRIAVIITDMFQDVEYQQPADAFRKAGHDIVNVGISAGSVVKGEYGTHVQIDKAVRDVSADDFDALFIPGGYSPDKLRIDADAVRFAKEFFTKKKPVFAICHAAQLLITAQVPEGTACDRLDVSRAGHKKSRCGVRRCRGCGGREPCLEQEAGRHSCIYP